LHHLIKKVRPHPFLVANRMVRGSYVSLQSALAYYSLIPEYVAVTTCVTTARPARWETPLGAYVFRDIKPDLFYGYLRIDLGGGQHAFVASPEKALLDLVYLQPGGGAPLIWVNCDWVTWNAWTWMSQADWSD
jgi:predicted transcriptional regulator of viral defense system